jgi:hypothetical protein
MVLFQAAPGARSGIEQKCGVWKIHCLAAQMS